ncbi:glycosyltransferase [Bradyrhizobium ganzhouense]|uniref:glycosyltransferase n=1 Tax=Bradyrhizobium ganzhouense TaxID=1179767 RepID=UPI003CF4B1A2
MTKTPTLSISIVTYRSDVGAFRKALLALHRALAVASEAYPLSTTLFIVDNSCDPAWSNCLEATMLQAFPETATARAEFIKSTSNSGYGRGNNIAIEKARSDYHLVLNPDVYLESDALRGAISYMEHNHQVGLLSPAVYGSDGRRHHICKRDPDLLVMTLRGFCPSRLRSFFQRRLDLFEMRDRDYAQIITDVQYPTGCFMFFRTRDLKRIGGFDPRFFLHFEDADAGRRLRQIAAIHYLPSVQVVHDWAGGVRQSWRRRWLAAKSGIIYFSKWNGALGASESVAMPRPELREKR